MSLIVDREVVLVKTKSSPEAPAYAALKPSAAAAPACLFEGVEAAVSEALGVESLRRRSALHALGRPAQVPRGSVAVALDAISANWKRGARAGLRTASRENWRWCAPQTFIGVKNRSPEVVLERAIA